MRKKGYSEGISPFWDKVNKVSGVFTIVTFGPTLYILISNPNARVGYLLLVFFVVLLCTWFFLTFIEAKNSFKTEKETPFPKPLWIFLCNALPVTTGKKYESKTKILIIYDNSNEDAFLRIKSNHKDVSLEIDSINISVDRNLAADLEEKLAYSDALLFFYTEEIQEKPMVYGLINNWALKNSHKAVLAVTDLPYNITFNTIPSKEADSSLWRLLSRSTERSYQWVKQAKWFRLVGIGLAVTCILITLVLFNNFLNAGKRMEVLLPSLLENNLLSLHAKASACSYSEVLNNIGHNASRISEGTHEVFEDKKREFFMLIKCKLDLYAGKLLSELNAIIKTKLEDQNKSKVSIWAYSEKIGEIIKIASSEIPPKLRSFEFASKTMTVSSFLKPGFIMFWKLDLKEGDLAAWSWQAAYRENKRIGNKHVLGVWKKDDGDRFFMSSKQGELGGYVRLKLDPPKRRGFLCYSELINPEKTAEKYTIGVSIETSLPPDFLLEVPEVSQLMIKAFFVLKSLPEDLIVEYINALGYDPYALDRR